MTIESETCTVSRPVLTNLIYAVVHTLASSEYVALPDDEHYQGLVTTQVESILVLAAEAGVDIWAETTGPVGREMMPIAYLLREADDRFGLLRACPVPGCTSVPLLCCPRPPHLPAGTAWPSAPEICRDHTDVRVEVLRERVRQQYRDDRGPRGARRVRVELTCLEGTRLEPAGERSELDLPREGERPRRERCRFAPKLRPGPNSTDVQDRADAPSRPPTFELPDRQEVTAAGNFA